MTKPPLGLKPESVHNSERAIEILEAMTRYVLAYESIPNMWIEELTRLYGEE